MNEFLKDYIRGFDAEGKKWLKSQYVKNSAELRTDQNLESAEKLFLVKVNRECLDFLMFEEAQKQ